MMHRRLLAQVFLASLVTGAPSLADASGGYEYQATVKRSDVAAAARPVWRAVKNSHAPLRAKLKAGAIILRAMVRGGDGLAITRTDGGSTSWAFHAGKRRSSEITVAPDRLTMEVTRAKVALRPTPHHDLHFRRTIVQMSPHVAVTTERGVEHRSGEGE